jgi:hypothetical protein
MVLAMVLVLIGFLLATVALTTTLASRTNAARDERSKRAQQAADAGIQTALYRINQTDMGALQLTSGLNLRSVIKNLLVCPIPQVNANGQIGSLSFTFVANATLGNACPSNSASGTGNPFQDTEPVGHHAYFQVQYDPGLTNIGDFVEFKPTIVSDGLDDNGQSGSSQQYVSQRAEAILSPFMPWRTLEAENNLEIDIPAAAGTVGVTAFNGTAAAGGDLTLKGQGVLGGELTGANVNLASGLGPAAIDYCGTKTVTDVTLSVFLGNITKPASGCGGLVNRPAISITSTKSDCVPTSGQESCGSDPNFGASYVAGRNADGSVNNNLSNEDEVYDASGAPISFGPGDYVFCSFYANGPVSLNPTSTEAVRIFIDSPNSSRCSGFVSHDGIGAGSFTATRGVGNLLAGTHPSQGQIYVTGTPVQSHKPSTSVTMTASSSLRLGQAAFVYAPQSSVTVDSSALAGSLGTLWGSFIGYNLTVSAAVVDQDLGLLNYPLSDTLGPFHVQQYVECSSAYPLPSPATSGC